jgi:hypothetical protein
MQQVKDLYKRELVNGIVILRNTLIWNSFHSERQLDLFKCHKTLILIIRDTYPLLNNSKNIELRLILKYCHMLLETTLGILIIMIILTLTSIRVMHQKNIPLKLIMIYQTQPIFLLILILLSLAQLLKKLNLQTKKQLPNLKVSLLQNHGANLLLLTLILMQQIQMMLLLIQMKELVLMLPPAETILPTLLLHLIPLLLLTKNKRPTFLIISNPSNTRFKLKLKLKIPQSLPKKSIKK